MAMRSLEAKLAERERLVADQQIADLRGERRQATFGMQCRSYVLSPYRLVVDRRSGHQTGDVDAVLSGDIDGFIEAWLRWRLGEDGGLDPRMGTRS